MRPWESAGRVRTANGISAGARTFEEIRSTTHGTSITLDRRLEEGFLRLWEVCAEAGNDPETDSITPDGYRAAEALLAALPENVPLPDILVHPDGEIAFEWHRNKNHVVTVSASADGSLAYGRSVRSEYHLWQRGFLRFLSCTDCVFSGSSVSDTGFLGDKSTPLNRFAATLFFTKEFKQLSAGQACVRPAAFMVRDLSDEYSVYRIAHLWHAAICCLGDWRVSPGRRKDFYGYARLTINAVLRIGPSVIPNEPPRRHAGIVGWPTTKAERMSIAKCLAAASDYVPVVQDSPNFRSTR